MKKNYIAVVYGSYGLSNLGDDALMVAMHNVLLECFQSEDILILVKQKGPYLQKLIPNGNFELIENMDELNTKFFIYGGGTLFFSFNNKIPSKIQNIYDIVKNRKLLSYIKKKILNKKISYESCLALGIGIGPFEIANSFIYAKNNLESCDFISVRDQASFRFCEEWNMKKTVYGSDICFANEYWLKQPSLLHNESLIKYEKNIGIIVRDWYHTSDADYMETLLLVKKTLEKENYKFEFIVFSKNDIACIRFFNKHKIAYSLWTPEIDNIIEVVSNLQRFSLVISSRYHGVVLSSIVGVPSIAIDIEPKLELISKILNTSEYLWSKPFESNDLIIKIKDFIKNYDEKKKQTMKSVKHEHDKSFKMINEFIQHINCR